MRYSNSLSNKLFFVPQPKGKVDSPEEFIYSMNGPDLRGEKRYELIASLRVALTNNPVRYVRVCACLGVYACTNNPVG